MTASGASYNVHGSPRICADSETERREPGARCRRSLDGRRRHGDAYGSRWHSAAQRPWPAYLSKLENGDSHKIIARRLLRENLSALDKDESDFSSSD